MFFLFSLVIKFVFLLFMSFCSHGILALDLLLLLLVLIGVFFFVENNFRFIIKFGRDSSESMVFANI